MACGSDAVKSPFDQGFGGAGGEAGAQGNAGFRLDIDAGVQVDPALGGPCEDDGQCNDQVDCTRDHCDAALGRCRFTPNDAACDDGVYCDGAERCDVRTGCVAGEVVACSDNSTCTIDTCIEETQSCRHDPRDADGDGDPTADCGGRDCADTNPLVNSFVSEICRNGIDDNCNGLIDEQPCVAPAHDTCKTALKVTKPGYYDVDLTGTALDYPTSCATQAGGFRDAVLEVTLPTGGPFDVDVTAKLDAGKLSLGTANSCGDGASASCEPSFVTPLGASAARMILRGLEAGTYPLYVAADSEGIAQVHVELRRAEPHLGDLCEDAPPLMPGASPLLVRLPGYAADLKSACAPLTGDAFASFTLAEASDVTLVAEAQNNLGLPVLSLLDERCKRELTCRKSQPGRLFVRDLQPGIYRVMVAATAPDDVSVRLETGPVSATPPGEGCDNPLHLVEGVEQIVDLSTHEDAVNPKCLTGAPDSTFELELAGQRDVALVGRFSQQDEGAVSMAGATCTANTVCKAGSGSQRAVQYGLAKGIYRAVIESARGNPVGLSWFERPAVAPTFVAFADNCDQLLSIPEMGGRFIGNTSNEFPDFSAGCDVGGQKSGGAPDQILKLSLGQARRVILDMQGSSYATMLSVRQGKFCPGIELPLACAVGSQPSRSYLDLDLKAGDYFVLIDGYDGASGSWKLDVFTAPL